MSTCRRDFAHPDAGRLRPRPVDRVLRGRSAGSSAVTVRRGSSGSAPRNLARPLPVRTSLAADVGLPPSEVVPGRRSAACAVNLPSEAAVDAAFEVVAWLGARVVKEPERPWSWGGYSGYSPRTSDGHLWELSPSTPGSRLDDHGPDRDPLADRVRAAATSAAATAASHHHHDERRPQQERDDGGRRARAAGRRGSSWVPVGEDLDGRSAPTAAPPAAGRRSARPAGARGPAAGTDSPASLSR